MLAVVVNIVRWALTMPPTTRRLRSTTPERSAGADVSLTPKSLARPAISTSLALATMVLVGMHATLMQVPPIWPFSIRATRCPALASAMASDFPPFPPPSTTSSYCSVIESPSRQTAVSAAPSVCRIEPAAEATAPFSDMPPLTGKTPSRQSHSARRPAA